MALQDQLMADLREAMRAGDVERREAIRMLRAAILNQEIEVGHPLGDDEAAAVVMRLAKRHRESIEEFQRGNRPDLVTHEQAQLAAIEAYLPRQMGRDEVEAHVRAAIAATGAASPGDVGKVMRQLSAELRGKADLKLVNQVALELLRG